VCHHELPCHEGVITDENGNALRGTRNSDLIRKAMSIVARLITLAATFLSVALLAVPAAAAEVVPITLKYAGTFEVTLDDPNCEDGEVPITDTLTGTGSHLGRLTATYPHCVDFVAGTFSGTATFTAANGDQLLVLLEGKAGEYPACTPICAVTFTGTITSGGTGRFVDADGTLSGPGTVDLGASTITAVLTGTINKDPQLF